METLLKKIYGDSLGIIAYDKLRNLIQNTNIKGEKYQECFSESDVVLITYGDSIKIFLNCEKNLEYHHNCRTKHTENFVLNKPVHLLLFFFIFFAASPFYILLWLAEKLVALP